MFSKPIIVARYGPSDRTDVIHKPKYIKNDTKYDPNNEIELMKTILGDDEDDHEENVILPATDTDNLPILLTKNCKRKIFLIFSVNLQ